MQQPSITIMSHGSDYLTTWNKSSEIWTMATRVGSLWSWVGDSRVGSLSLPSRPLPLIRKLRSAPDQVDQVDQSQHYLWNVVDGLPSCIKSQRISTISFDLWVLASSHWKVTRPHMQMWKWWKMKGKTWSCDKDCWNRICPGKWMSWIEPDANTFQMSIGPFKTFWTSRLNKSLSPFAAKMLRCCRCCLMRLAVYNMTT